MNRVIFIGRLTKDPEVRWTETGTCYAKFGIAVDRRYKKDNDPTADFFSCTAWGKTAEFVEKYIRKGMKIALEGRVENNNYTDRNGVKVYSTAIIVESLEFAESKNANGGSNEDSDGSKTNEAAGQTDGDGFMNIPNGLDEELPFA